MSDKLQQPYEISLWEDILVESEDNSYYKEIKIATIGSDLMTAPSRAINPVLTANVNGEITLSFDMVHKYYDTMIDGYTINPFEKYLVNERKVKLFFDNQWYDFIIKSCEESSSTNVFKYTAKGLFVNELGRVGYNITLSNDLNNNQGTIFELAKKVVEGTDWEIDEENSDTIQQLVAEPLYIYKNNIGFKATDLQTQQRVTIGPNETLFIFYSTAANSLEKNVQFLRESDFIYSTLDDNNVAQMPNYWFEGDTTAKYDADAEHILVKNVVLDIQNDEPVIGNVSLEKQTDSINKTGINSDYQGYRLAYNQRVAYDEINERPVSVYKAKQSDDHETTIYKYTDYEYVTSDVVTSYVTDGSNFNVFNDGSMEGWSNTTPSKAINNKRKLQPLELVNYPDVNPTSILDLTGLEGISSFLRTEFKATSGKALGYVNSIFNSGIGDYRDQIGSFSKGEEYVFRIAYGTSTNKNGRPLAKKNDLIRAVVCKYKVEPQITTDEETGSTSTIYVYTPDTNNIILQFYTGFTVKNNVISGGYFGVENNEYVTYYKDGVSIAPSVDYIYEQEKDGVITRRIWDSDKRKFVAKGAAFLDYYYTTAKVLKSVSNADLMKEGNNYGLFLYTASSDLVSTNNNPIYTFIKEVQLFKKKVDADGEIVMIGNVPKSTAFATDYYYIKPESDATVESIETYSTLKDLADSLNISSKKIQPEYNDKFEKISSIEASQSNCFNIIQDLCEAFECWAKFTITHDKNGAITLDKDGNPQKKISFHKYSGKDNFAGFKYGINLESIERTIDSDEFVSKLIVEQVENDTVDGGVVSIASAPSNPSGESYIFNMSYYLNHGLIENPQAYYQDYNKFITQIKNVNKQYNSYKTQLQLATIAKAKADANVNTYSQLIKEAKEKYNDAITEFKDLTGLEYSDYIKNKGYSMRCVLNTSDITIYYSKQIQSIVPSFYSSKGDEILMTVSKTVEHESSIEKQYKIKSSNSTSYTVGNVKWIAIVEDIGNEGFRIAKYDGTYSDYAGTMGSRALYTQTPRYIWKFNTNSTNKEIIISVIPTESHEELTNLVGTIYTSNQIIKQYTPLLEMSKTEKKQLDLLIDGTKNYTLTVSTFSQVVDGVLTETTKESLSDYFTGLTFLLKNDTGSASVSSSLTEKYFSQDKIYKKINFQFYPKDYRLKCTYNGREVIYSKSVTITLPRNSTKIFTFIPVNKKEGIKDKMERLLGKKKEIEKAFYQKYSRYIQEGSWTSSDYVDNELYYLDALKVSRTSAQPKVSYNLAVYEISEQEGFENYKFNVGDKTYIEDTQFFGYNHKLHNQTWLFDVIDYTIYLPKNTTNVMSVTRGHEASYGVIENYTYDPEDNTITIPREYEIEENEQFSVYYTYKISTPIREEVVVSEVTWNLDDPTNNSITIQNYRTQFDDLFSRIAAAVQSVEYNSASYSRAASILDEGGFINAGLLLKSLNELGGGFSLSGDNTITAAQDGIVIRDTLNPQQQMKIAGNGVKTSIDGGQNWNTVLNANGLRIDTIDTQNVIIKDGENPSFRWDKYGLNAYGFESDVADLSTYVRYDKYGLYGVKNGRDFQAKTLQDIKDSAQFGLLWDGFFIKNNYTNGYVSISSDEDFQVVGNGIERIKIGALSQDTDGNYEYGIRIRNNLGQNVFVTDDSGDIEITGTINATGGTFTKTVSVGSGDHSIILEGQPDNAIIGSSDYFNDATKGWAIRADGDAIFNNITARGAIKTAVFEYSEIEAVGGIFVFRPSSTIRTAEIPIVGETDVFTPCEDTEIPIYYVYNEDDDQYLQIDYPIDEAIETAYYVYDAVSDEYDGVDEAYNYYTYNENNDKYDLVQSPVASELENYYIKLKVNTSPIYDDDLLLTVENPLLFSVGDWCKVSNYTPDNELSALSASGLINVFEISSIVNNVIRLRNGANMFRTYLNPTILSTNEYEISGSNNIYTLSELTENLTTKYNYDILIMEIMGIPQVSIGSGVPNTVIYSINNTDTPITYLGNLSLWNHNEEFNTGESYLYIVLNDVTYLYVGERSVLYDENGNNETITLQIQTKYNANFEIDSLVGGALISFANYPTSIPVPNLTKNYGIGINSSDSAVNLPARAITLFESEVYPNEDVKIGYNIRGIFGTLPALGSDKVSQYYTNNLQNTQGIFTDNIYIGNADQFVTFYTDNSDPNNPEKKLVIQAKSVSYEIKDDEGQGTGEYQDISDIEGMPGPPGPAGHDAIRVEIDSTGGNFFKRGDVDTYLIAHVYEGFIDITNQVNHFYWYRRLPNGNPDPSWSAETTTNMLQITTADVDERAVFVCEITLPN